MLSRKKRQLENDVRNLRSKKEKIDESLKRKLIALDKVNSTIDNTYKGVIITDHAVLRYLERVKGIDIQAIREEILVDDRMVEAIKILGDGLFPVDYGRLRIRDKMIVTILDNE